MRVFLKLGLLFFIFTFNVCYSQDNAIQLDHLIQKNFFSNPKKAKILSKDLLMYAKNNDLLKYESLAYFYLGDLSGLLSQKDSVNYCYDKAIQIANQINDKKLILKIKINKANYLVNNFLLDDAMLIYDQCLKIAEEIDDSETSDYIKVSQGMILYDLEKYELALQVFIEGNKIIKSKSNAYKLNELNLAKTYLKLKQFEKSLFYSRKGISDSQKSKNKEYEIAFLQLQGLTFIELKNNEKAKKSFYNALSLSKDINSFDHISNIKIEIAKLFTIENKNKQALEVLNEIIFENEKIIFSNELLAEIYYLLAENYKLTNEFSKSNEYYQKFIEKSKSLNQKKIETIDYLNKIKLAKIEENEVLQKNQKLILILTIGVLILFFILMFFYRRKKEILNQKKFDILIEKISEFEKEKNTLLTFNNVEEILKREKTEDNELFNENINPLNSEEENNSFDEIDIIDETLDFENNIESHEEIFDFKEETNNPFVIKEITKSEILEKLLKLEEKKYFLKQECTLHTVAKKLKTNTAYLSKIVNIELNKSFSTYINELRINYIIVELKNNLKLRSYSVNAIAEEIGYKRPESFTKYFKEATGITPAVYIRKLNKTNEI